MNKIFSFLCILMVVNAPRLEADTTLLPPFLPDYYLPALGSGAERLVFIEEIETEGFPRFLYSSHDKRLGLSIEYIPCGERPCDAFYSNLLNQVNELIESHTGEFMKINGDEFHAEIELEETKHSVFAFMLPESILIWTYFRDRTDSVHRRKLP